LSRSNLLTEHVPGRYSCHDLLRAYAADTARSVDPEPERRNALARVLDHYVRTAHAAAELLYPGRVPPTVLVPGPAEPVELVDERAAVGWLTAEHAVLLACFEPATDAQTWLLAWDLGQFLRRRGEWQHSLTTWHAAADAADRAGTRRPGRTPTVRWRPATPG
jgi:hypothetical protein